MQGEKPLDGTPVAAETQLPGESSGWDLPRRPDQGCGSALRLPAVSTRIRCLSNFRCMRQKETYLWLCRGRCKRAGAWGYWSITLHHRHKG